MRIAKIFGWAALTLLILVIVAVVILLSLDLSTYRGPLQRALGSAFGRTVHLKGEMSFAPSLYPTVVLEDVSIANPAWASRPNFADAERVEAQFALWPLLRGNPQILSLVVVGLDVLFEIGPEGTDNWTFGTEETTVPPVIESLSCQQCTLAYGVDAKHEERLSVSALAGVLAAQEPVQMLLSAKYRGVTFNLSLLGGTLPELMRMDRPWPIEAKLHVAGAALDAQGAISGQDVKLRFGLNGDRLEELVALAKLDVPAVGPYALAGDLVATRDDYRLMNLSGHVGERNASDRLVINEGRVSMALDAPVDLQLEGKLGKNSYTLSATGGTLNELLAAAKPWPVALTAMALGAKLDIQGTVSEPLERRHFDLRAQISGEQFAELVSLVRTPLAALGPYALSAQIASRDGGYSVRRIKGHVGEPRAATRVVIRQGEINVPKEEPLRISLVATYGSTPLRLSGRMRRSDEGYRITELKAQVDRSDVSGTIDLDLQGLRPKLEAKLVSNTLDIEQLAGLAPGTPARSGKTPWLERTVDTGSLSVLDADIDLSVKRLAGTPAPIGDLALSAKIDSGKAAISIAQVSISGATAQGQLTLDASGRIPNMVLDVSSTGVQLPKGLGAVTDGERLRGTAERVELYLASSGRSVRTLLQRAELKLAARAMSLDYRRVGDGTTVPIKISTADATVAPGEAVRVALEGTVREVPIKANFTGDSLSNLISRRDTWPLDLQLQAADAALTVKGQATQPLKGEGFDVEFDLRGQHLSALEPLFDTQLPELGAYELSGRFVNGAGTHELHDVQIGAGKHRALASVKMMTTVTPPRIVAKLHSGTLNLDQLAKLLQEGEAKTTAHPKTSRVLPAFTIPRDWPRKMNLEMDIDIPDVIAEATDVGDLKVKLDLKDGHFTLGPVRAKLFGGDAFGKLDLDVAKDTPTARLKLTVRKLDYGRWLKAWDITDTVTGEVNISVDMRGSGDTLRAMFDDSNGAVLLASGPTHIADSDMGLWGAGFTSGLMSITTSALGMKKSTEFNCMVWPFNVSDGVARSEAILMDTPKITIAGSGTIDLSTEALDILLEPARKKASIFSFQNPVRISGTLADPKRTTLGKAKTFGKLGLVILEPWILVFTASTGTGEKNPCVAALAGEPPPAKKRRKKKAVERDLGLVGQLLTEIQKPVDETRDTSESRPEQ
jgi:uncharacterized protein involved in outer membrane biogenesis